MLIKRTVACLEKLCSRSRLLVTLYSFPYRRVIKNEIALTEITADDRVLNIGCGAIPFTALLIAQFTGARVTAVDRDPDAARRAAACVRRQGWAHRVRVVCCDAARPPWTPADFDVALIALQAEPKAPILAHLLGGMAATRVAARAPSAAFQTQYDPLPQTYTLADAVAQNMKTFDRSVLFLSSGAARGAAREALAKPAGASL